MIFFGFPAFWWFGRPFECIFRIILVALVGLLEPALAHLGDLVAELVLGRTSRLVSGKHSSIFRRNPFEHLVLEAVLAASATTSGRFFALLWVRGPRAVALSRA